MAHDFNNLLTGILGYADMALNELSSQHPIYGYLKEIKKAGERAAGLTRQLLTFSRRQVLQLKALDLNEIVAEMDQMLRRLIGEDIELLTLPDPHLKRIKADPGQLEQVLLNLAINSRDAMPRGGALTIWTENVELDDTYSKTHPELRPGKYIMLMVSDTGEGMDKGTLSHIFEPFFTTKEQGKGTGLGLSTVYGIVEQCGGHIWVYSEKGLGTVFKIYFPVVEEEPDNQTRVEEKKGEEFGEYTVLLVEDEEMVQGLVKKILENNGMRVLVAGNGAEALALTRQYEGRIDLVLTDLVMPRMGGGELANRLREVAREVKVLFMSGYNREQLGGPEADLYEPLISKPFTAASLLTKVRELLVG